MDNPETPTTSDTQDIGQTKQKNTTYKTKTMSNMDHTKKQG